MKKKQNKFRVTLAGILSITLLAQLLYSSIVFTGLFAVPGTASAAAPQGTMTGWAPIIWTAGSNSLMNELTITDHTTAEITAVNDIRIKIPATSHVIWDTTDTDATIGGTAAVKVFSTVSYEDAGKTLVLDVSADFANSETVTVSDLTYKFIAAHAAAPLTYSIDGGVTYGNGDSNTELSATAADAGATFTLANAAVAGSGTLTLNFTVIRDIDAGDTVSWTMPAWITVTQGALTVDSGGISVNCTGVNATRVITCTSTGNAVAYGGVNVNVVLAAGSVTANYVATGTNAITDFLVYDTSLSANTSTDSTVDITNTTIGALSATNVEPAVLTASTSTTATISFTSATSIPNLGKIAVTFPAGYDVSGANGATASSLSGLNGTWTASVAGQVVTLTQTGGSSSAAGAKSLVLSGIITPSSLGATGTYTITTKIAAGNNIETNAAVASDTIVAGGGVTSNDPPSNLSVTVKGYPVVYSNDVELILSARNTSHMRISNYPNFIGSNWEKFSVSKNWHLVDGYGVKTVYVQFKDSENNMSRIMEAMVTVSPAPGVSIPLPTGNPLYVPGTRNENDALLNTALPPGSLSSNPLNNSSSSLNKLTRTPEEYSQVTSSPGKVPPTPDDRYFTKVCDLKKLTQPQKSIDNSTGNAHWAKSFQDEFKKLNKSSSAPVYTPLDQSLTRAELVQLAIGSFQIDVSKEIDQTFPDADPSAWYASYLTAAHRQGLIIGYLDGLFRPGQLVSRAEALKILLLSSGLSLCDVGQAAVFADTPASAWYSRYIQYAFQRGIISGRAPGVFAPDSPITWGEAFKMVVNLWRIQQ